MMILRTLVLTSVFLCVTGRCYFLVLCLIFVINSPHSVVILWPVAYGSVAILLWEVSINTYYPETRIGTPVTYIVVRARIII